MMTITIAAISIGISVDNSIHYIYRFREELPKKDGDYVATLHYCHCKYRPGSILYGNHHYHWFSILVLSNFIPTIYLDY